MKLLQVTNNFPPDIGGMENYAYSVARRWKPDDIVVLTRMARGSREFDAELPFDVFRLKEGTLWPTRSLLGQIQQAVEGHGIDAIHFMTPQPQAFLGPKILESHGTPFFVTINGSEFTMAASLPVVRGKMLRALSRSSLLLPYASFLEGEVRRALPNGPPTVAVPPGVDESYLERNLPPAFDPPEGGKVILSASRVVRRKGFNVVLKALPEILKNHPDVHYLVVGGGPELDRLRKMASRLEVSNSVTFAGPVPWRQMPNWYAGADIFALPVANKLMGLETEGFGIVFLEAAAQGLPIVAGTVGGIPDAVTDGETGFLVDGRDHAAVARALTRLLDDPALAQRMGDAGRSRVEQHFTWDRFFERFTAAVTEHVTA